MYQLLTEIPVPSSAHFTDSNVIHVLSTVHDHVRDVKRTISNSLVLTDGSSVTASPFQNVTEEVALAYSPSGSRRAVLRESKDQSETKRFIEIWKQNEIEASMEVTKRHGAFYTDEYVASLSFSHSETSLLYIAESNAPEASDDDPYRKFRFTPQLGEGFGGKRRPTIFVFFWKNGPGEPSRTLAVLENSSPVLLGQAVFGPRNDVIYATGFEYTSDHRLLGVKGCFNRPSGIWEITPSSLDEPQSTKDTVHLKCTFRKLTPSNLSCRSPRVIPNGEKSTLTWLSETSGGAHAGTSMIYSLDITSTPDLKQFPSPLVDVIHKPEEGAFPGLYPDPNFVPYPALRLHTSSVRSHLITTSTWGSRSTIVLVSLADGSVKNLTPIDDELYSWKVLNTDGHSRVVCSRSAPLIPHQVVLGEFNEAGEVSWRVIQKPTIHAKVQEELSSLKASIITIPDRYPTETILIRSAFEPREKRDIRPCITMPHGGPHATTTTAFSPAMVALALERFTVSMPNYTGSLGFGESAVQALIGNCGTVDVEDCIASARHLVKLGISIEGPGKQLIMGGSHGGFLSGHLLGQHPKFFSAGVIRNPVMSVGEIANSDIPDWYFSEFGMDYPVYSSPSAAVAATEPESKKRRETNARPPIMVPEVFERLYRRSPISHVDAVRASVLLLVGTVDQRVSPTQGIEYYHALKQRAREGVRIELMMFDGESHPLDGVEAARVGWEATRDFFKWAETLLVQWQS